MYILGRQSGESGKSRQRNGYRKVSSEKKVQESQLREKGTGKSA